MVTRRHPVLRRLSLGLAAVALAVASWALLATFVLHGRVDPGSLHTSVAAATASADRTLGLPAACVRRGAPGAWTCDVLDTSGSGGVDYRVAVEPSGSCWAARRTSPDGAAEAPMPERADGCVRRWQWSVFDLL